MDNKTIEIYTARAATMAANQRAISPNLVRQHILEHFISGQPTADIGCGSGRDVAWLNQNGFPAHGYEPSEGMLQEARQAYPGLGFSSAALPGLTEIPNQTYTNVLCNAVLMHLPSSEVRAAFTNLARILKPGGRLICTYRHSREQSEREKDGRLFTNITDDLLKGALGLAGLKLIHQSAHQEEQRPAVYWHHVVVVKPPP